MQKAKQPVYLIKSTMMDGQLFIDLSILDGKTGTKIIKYFGKSYNDDNLPEDVKKNFKDINNVHSILTQNPSTCDVDTNKGILTLTYQVIFPNGSKFKIQGKLELEQKQLPVEKSSSTIKGDDLQQKIIKIEENIKLIQSCQQSESKLRQNIINKVLKDISTDIEGLKQKYQEIKNWKKNQQTKFNQLLNEFKDHQIKPEKGDGKITDEVLHIFYQKSDQHKQIFTDRFQKHAQKIQDIKDTTNRHQKYIDKSTQQNIELKKTVKTLQDKVTKLLQKNQLFEEKLNELLQSHKKAVKVINSQHEEIQNVKKQVTSPKKQQKTQINPLELFMTTLEENSPNRKATTTTNFSMYNVQSPKAQKVQKSQDKPLLTIPEFMQIHPSSGYSKQFINNGKVFSYNGVSQQPTQLVGKPKVTSNKCSFVTVSKTKNNQIGIGIIDSKYILQRNSIKKPNCIIYNASNGALYESGGFITSDGTGFRQGDKVKMKVILGEGIIQWSIGGIPVCKHKSEKIKDSKIEWLPFIRMCDRGDAVKWTIE